jgi:hypothetical protein
MATLNRTFSVKNGIDIANTIIVDSNLNVSNISTINATNFVTSAGLNVTDQANSAYAEANVAHNQANTAYSQANSAYAQANAARDQANTAYGQANDAFAQANTARGQANDAYAQANTARGQANAAYAQANLAYAAANTSGNTVRVSVNSGSTLSNKQLNFVNTETSIITVTDSGDGNANISVAVIGGGAIALAYDQANTARDTANAAYAQANSARDQANTAYGQANDAYAQANTARNTANSAYDQANLSYAQANAAYAEANTKIEDVYTGLGLSNTVSDSANVKTITITANVATTAVQGITKLIDSTSSTDTANAATANAVNAVYEFANTKLSLSGGIIIGDVTVDGNLFVNGAQTIVNTESLTINDPIFLLANNNTTNSVGLGFTAHYGPTQQHTGLIRAHQDNNWYLFEDYDEHILYANNVLDTSNIKLATLKANISANSILLVGNTVATQANLTLAHNQANTARATANDAYGQANLAYGQANTARDQANTAYGQANAAYSAANTANANALDAYAQANAARDQANTAYGQANLAYSQANTAYGQANDAYGQANAAFAAANNRVLKAGDTMTGALVINTSGIGLTVANANVTYSLQVNSLNVTTNTVTTSSPGQVVLDKFPITQLASSKYFVQANSATDYQTTEIVLVQDATNVWITEYGSIQTGPSLGTFTADISGGDVRLLFTAVNNINTIRSVRYGIIP